jgi:hypothetical protein
VLIIFTLLAGFVPLLQVTFFALLEDFYLDRLVVKDQDKTPRIIGLILIRKLHGSGPKIKVTDRTKVSDLSMR